MKFKYFYGTKYFSAMGLKDTLLHIEPGIFEWLGWYQLGLPKFFTPTELKSHGFNIDVNYKQFFPITKFDLDESIEGYYRRSGDTARHILRQHEKEGNNMSRLMTKPTK